jgi:hypothetical protein
VGFFWFRPTSQEVLKTWELYDGIQKITKSLLAQRKEISCTGFASLKDNFQLSINFFSGLIIEQGRVNGKVLERGF